MAEFPKLQTFRISRATFLLDGSLHITKSAIKQTT